VAPLQGLETRGNKRDLFSRGQRDYRELVRNCLSQMSASGTVIGIVVAGERRLVVSRLVVALAGGGLAMMMMAGMLRNLMASVVVLCRAMRMSANC
jgi:hypothetical protein